MMSDPLLASLLLLASCLFLFLRRGQRPNLAEPAQSDRGAESADDDAIDFPQQYAGQDHEVGGSDAGVQVQLPADEGCSLVCRDPDSCGGYFLHIVFKRQG